MMKKQSFKDPLGLLRLRSSHDSAIRQYYVYELLSKLLIAQKKTLWQELLIPLQIAGAVIVLASFFAVQNLAPWFLVFVLVIVEGLILVPAIYQWIGREKENVLDDVVYLGIYLDEVAKYAKQIELAQSQSYDQSDPIVTDFIQDSRSRLVGSLTFLKETLNWLKTRKEYPACLTDIGRKEDWVKKLDKRIASILGSGFLD